MGSLPNLSTLTERPELQRPTSQLERHVIQPVTCAALRAAVNYRHQGHHHHKVQHTRSAGANQHASCWDDYMLEQMATYSPISSRSTRSTATAHSHHHHIPSRRRDSLSSSGGASSVRRLIAVVRSTPSRFGPVYSRRVLYKNFAALCLGHATVTAALLPLLPLQSAISAWWWPTDIPTAFLKPFHPANYSGSLLLCCLFGVASISSLVSSCLVQRLGTNWTLLLGYLHACVFFGLHLYPTVYTLVPVYLLMGLWYAPVASARVTFLMTLASKLSYVITEEEDEDDVEETGGRREAVVRKLSRGLQVAQDCGLVVGNVVSALLLWYTLPSTGWLKSRSNDSSTSLLDAMFLEDESGDRICGRDACPVSQTLIMTTPLYLPSNASQEFSADSYSYLVLPCKTSALLASVFLGCSVMGVALTAAFLDKIRLFMYQDPLERPAGIAALRSIRDAFRDPRLQLAAPMSVFIGLEQGFIYADFSKSYVVCSLGVPNISLVFLSLGCLQSIAAFTLSMLLQHIRRYIAIAVGFVFHACLLLVLLLWRPTGDDPALFYVIAAAWGVCNAIWENLSFSLMVTVYPNAWQAPMAVCCFFRCLGLSLSFGVHGGLCNWVKLYLLAAALVIAVLPYAWLEMKLETRRRQKNNLATL